MRPGSLDRRITIERAGESSRDAMNAPVVTWSTLATRWAQVKPLRSVERFAAHEVAGGAVTTFIIRYLSGLTIKERVVYAGKTYDITDVREIGRKEGQEIDAVARPDV